MFFGGGFGGAGRRGRRPTRTRRGEDLSTVLTLSFTEAAFGVRQELQLERMVVCGTCLGNGAQPGTAPVACRSVPRERRAPADAAEHLRHRDDRVAVPDVRGHGAGDPRQVRDVLRGGAGARRPRP